MRLISVAKLYDHSLRTTTNVNKYVERVTSVLTSLTGTPNSNPETAYVYDIALGEGKNARTLNLELQPLLSNDQSLDEPHFIDSANTFLFFGGTLFLADPPPANAQEREVALLMAKKEILRSHVSTAKLRSEVAALEAIASRDHYPSRKPISDTVKRAVWVRDQGRCVGCGSTTDLQFDHIIPYSKGGGDSEQNLQILCGTCNRSKSDSI